MWRQRNPIKFSLIIPESGFTWWDYNMLTWRIDVGVEGKQSALTVKFNM
jgi:hypothetical protein